MNGSDPATTGSASGNFTITAPVPAPTITGFTPANGPVGTTVTINGTNFTNAATVRFNGTAASSVAFVSATELTATVPTGATTGKITVAVGGNTATSADDFTVDPTPNPVPTITSLAPNTAFAGGAAFTLTVNGTNFVNASVVNFNGAALTTTFVTAGQLTAAVPASAIAMVGSYNVTVTNPAPGGGTSGPATFSVTAGPLLAYDFQTSAAPTVTASNVSGSSFSRGSGVDFVSDAGTFSANMWTTATTLDANDYFEFTFTPASGFRAQLQTLTLDERRSNAGIRTWEVRSSLDNYTTTIGSVFSVPDNNVTRTGQTVTLGAAFSQISSAVTFRIYGYAAEDGGGNWRVDNVVLNGSVQAAAPTPEINLVQGAATIPSGTTGASIYTFTDTNAGSNSAAVTFGIQNTGTQVLTLGPAPIVTISGANAGEFSVSQPANSTVPASGTEPFTVTFAPTSAGAKTATISIANDDANESPYTFVVTGTGLSTAPSLTATPGTLSISANVGGSGSATYSLEARNLGANAAVTVASNDPAVEVSADNGTTYAATLNLTANASGALTQTIRVRFTAPATAGTTTATVTSTGGGLTATVTVTGTANAVTARRWDGGGGDGNFATAANWDNDQVPAPSENVLLDHSFVTAAYTVTLPAVASGTLSLGSLVINPNGGAAITAVLPSTNTAADYLRFTNPTDAFVIHDRGMFINSSGSTAGSGNTPVDVTPDGANFIIYNGGAYVHNTARSVSNLIDNLASIAGTEQGSFQYDPPSGSATTLSLSGRTYGTLLLRSTANHTFSGAGSSALTIRGDLVISPGVTFTPTLNSDILVGGSINNSGRFRFEPGSSTAVRRLILNGTTAQTISGNALTQGNTGTSYLGSNVILQINNPAGVTLNTDVVLNAQGSGNANNGGLELISGAVTVAAPNFLKLAADAVLLPATPSTTSFVNGALQREATFVAGTPQALSFAVGTTRSRPVTLNLNPDAAGTVTFAVQAIEQATPPLALGSGLVRVSGLRYYRVTRPSGTIAPVAGSTITLPFAADDAVNDLPTLRVAQNDAANNQYISLGGTATGSATNGSITATFSEAAFNQGNSGTFALGSAEATTNPLPVTLTAFAAQRQGNGALLRWTTAQELNSARFEVLRSTDGGREFRAIGTVAAAGNSTSARRYEFQDRTLPAGAAYYRLRQLDTDGTAKESAIVVLNGLHELAVRVYPNPAQDVLHLQVGAEPTQWQLSNGLGQVLRQGTATGTATLDVSPLPAGVYYLRASAGGQVQVQKVVKR